MGIFSKLKKALNPGGAIVSAVAGNGKNYIGPLDYAMDKDKTPKPEPAAPFDPGERTGSSINGQSGVNQPSMRLGWTNGGYTYHNSPFNQSAPMSFGGPQQPPLQGPPGGASMPPAGAQPPQGPPTMQPQMNPQMVQAMMLRNRGPMAT